MTTQPTRSKSEYKKRIAAFAVIAILVAAGLGVAVTALVHTQNNSSSQTAQTTFVEPPTEQNDFTLKGLVPVPLLTTTPENSTFALAYNATTLSSPVTSISFSLNQSYISIYTNGTEWVPYSQACSSSSESSSSETVPSQSSSFSVSVVTVSANSCDYPATLGWAPVDGAVVDQYAKLNSSQVELSVLPASVAANETVSLQFTITLNLKPGVYDIGLGLGVQTTNFFEFSDLNPFPVVVKS